MTRKPIGLTAPFRKENKMPMEIHKDKIVMRAGKYDLPKPWVDLTDDEIFELFDVAGTADADVNPLKLLADARRLEARIKEKNK